MGNLFEVIDSYDGSSAKFEILKYKEHQSLENTDHTSLKQVRVILDNGTVVTEAGALQLTQGHICSETDSQNQNNIFHKLIHLLSNQIPSFKPVYQGHGEIYLEPSFCHYILHKLENEEITVDQGMFYCCESSVKVSSIKPKNTNIQTKLSGSGICVLRSPVPESHILKFDLYDESLQIEPDCVILCSTALQSPIQNLKSFFHLFTKKNNSLETYIGTGQIWVAPTLLLNRICTS